MRLAMQKNVETLIGRLATDAALRRSFAEDPSGMLSALSDEGLELTAVERAALAAIDLDALHRFAGSLDRRLRRASTSSTSRRKSP